MKNFDSEERRRFQQQPGEPKYAEEYDMEKRLNETLADLMGKITKYMNLDTSYLDELKAEEAEWVVMQDGEHLYVCRKTVKDPKQLSILESHIYQARINALIFGAEVKIFSTENAEEDEITRSLRNYFKSWSLDPDAAMQYMNAYLKSGADPDEVERKVIRNHDEIRKNPDKYAPEPERATEYLAACVETLRQIVENHRFTKKQFIELYKPLEKLALKLTIFTPEMPEEERKEMREAGMSDKEIDAMAKGAEQCHTYYCQVFEIYRKLAAEKIIGR